MWPRCPSRSRRTTPRRRWCRRAWLLLAWFSSPADRDRGVVIDGRARAGRHEDRPELVVDDRRAFDDVARAQLGAREERHLDAPVTGEVGGAADLLGTRGRL